MQKIRNPSKDNVYVSDYRDVSSLKQIADKYKLAIILVHHIRKQGDSDVFNKMSGTTGIIGSADTNFILEKRNVEMDTVEGVKGGKVFLILIFRRSKFMLIYLMENKTKECVEEVFKNVKKKLGIELFKKLFEVVITDNGSEFFNPLFIEVDEETGEINKNLQHIYYKKQEPPKMGGFFQDKLRRKCSAFSQLCLTVDMAALLRIEPLSSAL